MNKVMRVTSKDDMDKVFKIREEVFVKEQGVPVELEKDEYDEVAAHVLVMNDEKPVGCGRVYLKGDAGKMGRIAVAKEYRKQGYGRLVCEGLIEAARELGAKEAVLGAQLTAIPFYENLGFEQEGDIFVDAGIDHIMMRKIL